MKSSALLSALTAVLFSVVPSFPSFAASVSSNLWTIDSEHSAVTFKVKHMSVGTVVGQFRKLSGTVNYDGKNLRDAAVEAAIDTNSVDTQSEKRDEHLK